ncbi:MAG: hydantoinase B/oxoprolinase family protein, partial [Acetobacteraceae bacterium]|nr:hydantoinase B/oxoprolinase family protein [Acetobacteraceae bacterium]
PHQTMGDFDAQMAANAVGVMRVQELAGRYGVAKVAAAMGALQDYSETRMRAAIRAVPDGTYRGEEALDDDGEGEAPIVVRTTVTVAGDSITVDFAGTDAQVGRNLNAPFASTISASVSALKAALTSPDIPFNDGAMRPITVTAPKGCLLNPRHPAPVRARMLSCSRAWEAVMGALAQVVPEQVIAPGFDTTTAFCLSHLGENGWSVYLEIMGGGFGATAGSDGADGIDNPLSNCSNTPAEALDQDFSFFRLTDYALRPGSGGAGRHRGGLGFIRRYEILKDGTKLALYSDRFRRPAAGLSGGAAGATGGCEVRRGNQRLDLKSKDSMNLWRGDVVTMVLGGGGGFGEPGQRDARLARRDAEDGYVDLAAE